MIELNFQKSKPFSVGIELELQLIDPNTYDLSSQVMLLLEKMQSIQLRGAVKPEITFSMVELNSLPHEKISTLHQELKVTHQLICEKAREVGILLAGGGIHPFQNWQEREIVKDYKDYAILYEKYDFWMKKLTVCGQHIHVGCENGDTAIYLMHTLPRYLPHFIALNAASPFYENAETPFHSVRLHALDAFPLSGTGPFLTSWAEFQSYYYQLMKLGIIRKLRDVYWDIRPQPDYGTIEIRVCDTPLALEQALIVAAYAQTLAYYLLEERPFKINKDIYLAYNHNRFQGARYGFDGKIITYPHYQQLSIQADILNTLDVLEPYAHSLDTTPYLETLRNNVMAKYNGAFELRSLYRQLSSLKSVVNRQTKLWMGRC